MRGACAGQLRIRLRIIAAALGEAGKQLASLTARRRDLGPVKGKTARQRVFGAATAVAHVIALTRGKIVPICSSTVRGRSFSSPTASPRSATIVDLRRYFVSRPLTAASLGWICRNIATCSSERGSAADIAHLLSWRGCADCVEGQNAVIEYHCADGLVTDLTRQKVDVIVTGPASPAVETSGRPDRKWMAEIKGASGNE